MQPTRPGLGYLSPDNNELASYGTSTLSTTGMGGGADHEREPPPAWITIPKEVATR